MTSKSTLHRPRSVYAALMKTRKHRTALRLLLAGLGFLLAAAGVVILGAMQIISGQLALLMLVALLGLYVGFGILFAVYRLVNRLS